MRTNEEVDPGERRGRLRGGKQLLWQFVSDGMMEPLNKEICQLWCLYPVSWSPDEKKIRALVDLLSDAFKANIICSHKPAGPCCPPSARFSDQIVSQALFVLTEDWICSQSVDKYNPTAKINPKTHITTDLNKTTDNHPKITEILSLNTHTSLFHHLSDTEGSVCGPALTQRPILGGVWRLVLNLSLQWN